MGPALEEQRLGLTERLGWLDALDEIVTAAVPLDDAVTAWGPPSDWRAVPADFTEQVDRIERDAAALVDRLDALPDDVQADTFLRRRLGALQAACRGGRLRARTLLALEDGDADALEQISTDGLLAHLDPPDPDPVMRSTDPTAQAVRALLGLLRADREAPHPSEAEMVKLVERVGELPPDFGLGATTPEVGAPAPPDTDGSKRLAALIEQAVTALVDAVDRLPGPVERLCAAVATSDSDAPARRAALGNLVATHWQIPLLVESSLGRLGHAPEGETQSQRADRARRQGSVEDLRACLWAIGAGAVPPTPRSRRMTPAVRAAVEAGIQAFDRRLRDLDTELRDDRSS